LNCNWPFEKNMKLLEGSFGEFVNFDSDFMKLSDFVI